MKRLAFTSLPRARFARAVVLTGLGGALLLSAGCAQTAARSAPTAEVYSLGVGTDSAILDKLSQALDENQPLEDLLRENSERLGDVAFRQLHADWDAYLNANPATLPVLSNQRGFFLHRELTRIARLKEAHLLKEDIASFDAFLFRHPDILRALDRRPALVGEPQFLIEHPALASFFDQHPSLSTVLLSRAERSRASS